MCTSYVSAYVYVCVRVCVCVQRQLDNSTIMPLSSGQRGVVIQTRSGTGGAGDTVFNRLVYQLTLGPDVHSYLQEGDNIFYCKGSDLRHGFTRREYFIINKLLFWYWLYITTICQLSFLSFIMRSKNNFTHFFGVLNYKSLSLWYDRGGEAYVGLTTELPYLRYLQSNGIEVRNIGPTLHSQ